MVVPELQKPFRLGWLQSWTGASLKVSSAYLTAWHRALAGSPPSRFGAVGISSCAPASAPESAAFWTSRRWKYRRPASSPRAMIPKRTVADRAMMTRLCPRFLPRSPSFIDQYSVTMVDCAEIVTPFPLASRITGTQGWKRKVTLTVTLLWPSWPTFELYQM